MSKSQSLHIVGLKHPVHGNVQGIHSLPNKKWALSHAVQDVGESSQIEQGYYGTQIGLAS